MSAPSKVCACVLGVEEDGSGWIRYCGAHAAFARREIERAEKTAVERELAILGFKPLRWIKSEEQGS